MGNPAPWGNNIIRRGPLSEEMRSRGRLGVENGRAQIWELLDVPHCKYTHRILGWADRFPVLCVHLLSCNFCLRKYFFKRIVSA